MADCNYGELAGNDSCNDETNITDWNYDGSDCCGACIDNKKCAECFNHEEAIPAIDLKSIDFNLYLSF